MENNQLVTIETVESTSLTDSFEFKETAFLAIKGMDLTRTDMYNYMNSPNFALHECLDTELDIVAIAQDIVRVRNDEDILTPVIRTVLVTREGDSIFSVSGTFNEALKSAIGCIGLDNFLQNGIKIKAGKISKGARQYYKVTLV